MKPRVLVRRQGETVQLVAGDVAITMSYEEASAIGAKLSHEAMLAASTALGNVTVFDVAKQAARWLRRRRRRQ